MSGPGGIVLDVVPILTLAAREGETRGERPTAGGPACCHSTVAVAASETPELSDCSVMGCGDSDCGAASVKARTGSGPSSPFASVADKAGGECDVKRRGGEPGGGDGL